LTGCWDLRTGERLARLRPHNGPVFGAAFSPDGKYFLTGSTDLTAQLWEAEARQPVGGPLRHQGQVWSVAFSPDGRLALTGSDDKTARVWEAASGRPVGPPLVDQHMTLTVVFSRDGKAVWKGNLLTASRLWDVATRKPLSAPLPHRGALLAAVFDADGRRVTVAGDTEPGTRSVALPAPLPGEPGRVLLWAQLATGPELGPDEGLRVLDATSWHERRRLLEALGRPALPWPAGGPPRWAR
jgi:WD40 repeat protein